MGTGDESALKSAWIQAGEAEVWQSIFGRLERLDVSSHAALSPLHRLFAFPERVDELMRHLEMVEEDERRQIDMIEASAQRLRESGYPSRSDESIHARCASDAGIVASVPCKQGTRPPGRRSVDWTV